MGTRSIVAYGSDYSWSGRYVHWDGYPTYMAEALWALVKRDGVSAVATTLIDSMTSWSSIDPDAGRLSTTDNTVVGYGVGSNNSEDLRYSHESEDLAGAEWLYILTEILGYNESWEGDKPPPVACSLIVKRVLPTGRTVFVEEFFFDEPEPNWQRLWDNGFFQRMYERCATTDVLVRFPRV